MSWALSFLVINGQRVWERDRVNIYRWAHAAQSLGLMLSLRV